MKRLHTVEDECELSSSQHKIQQVDFDLITMNMYCLDRYKECPEAKPSLDMCNYLCPFAPHVAISSLVVAVLLASLVGLILDLLAFALLLTHDTSVDRPDHMRRVA